MLNDGTGLGFGIIGGRSTGVVVKTILPGGVADRDGRLQSGDHILQIGTKRTQSIEKVVLFEFFMGYTGLMRLSLYIIDAAGLPLRFPVVGCPTSTNLIYIYDYFYR